ncbi:MAG: hypothetical protein QOK00_1782 [Thermoleophilaceae bacterium]|nr:hypothetical protein [Thermoleophilaceae bacterium]
MLLAVPTAAAAQATLTVDPVAPCYREQQSVFLRGTGFSPNAIVNFTRDGNPVTADPPIMADPSGAIFPKLDLPGLLSGQRQLTYVATDSTNPTLTAQVSLLVTATDATLRPTGGPPNRLLTIRGRGFFGGKTLYAHVVRTGRRLGKVRNLRIGAVKGACKLVATRKRLFSRDVRPGKYRVQFDTFRRYKSKRTVETEFIITLYPRAGTARAAAVSPAS